MRHAKAAVQEPHQSDFDRCLTGKGVRIALETATTLMNCGFHIERVIASAAMRTRQTADLVVEGMQLTAGRLDLEELYLAPAKVFEAEICERTFEDESSVLIVGHNPGIADLMCAWAKESLSVPPATVAVFESSADTWRHVRQTEVYVPTLICLVQDGKVAWQRDESISDPHMTD